MVENVRVHLVPVTKENIDEVLALQVREDQKSTEDEPRDV